MTTEEKIWTYLYNNLKNPYGTAALMGNLFAESSLNPFLANNISKHGLTNTEYTQLADENKTDFVNDGIAYGIAQWCYHTRKKGLLEKAKVNNTSVGDLDVQLQYLIEEIKKYSSVYKALINATNIRDASDIVLLKYEKPSNTSNTVKEKRASYGEKYFIKYNVKKEIKLQKKTVQSLLTALSKKIE